MKLSKNLTQPAIPFLRWIGSKAKSVDTLAKLVPSHFSTYHEPFAGSGALFFRIRPKRAVISDSNIEVCETFNAIKLNPGLVSDYLEGLPLNWDTYEILRTLNPLILSTEQRAARLIFLMKGCFNGVYRTNKVGKFNVPRGQTIYSLPTRGQICAASMALKSAEVCHADFRSSQSAISRDDFVYVDPPYPSLKRFRGEYGLKKAVDETDVHELAALLRMLDRRGTKVMLSYPKSEILENQLINWKIEQIEVFRTVGAKAVSRTSAIECVYINY
jgi:DNA adenine methylase